MGTRCGKDGGKDGFSVCETVDELWIKPRRASPSVRKRRSEAIFIHTYLCIQLLLEISDYEITHEFVGLSDQKEAPILWCHGSNDQRVQLQARALALNFQ